MVISLCFPLPLPVNSVFFAEEACVSFYIYFTIECNFCNILLIFSEHTSIFSAGVQILILEKQPADTRNYLQQLCI